MRLRHAAEEAAAAAARVRPRGNSFPVALLPGCGVAGTGAGGAAAVCAVTPVTGIGNASFTAVASGSAWCFDINSYTWAISYPALSAGAGASVAVATSGMTGSGFVFPAVPAAFPAGHTSAGTVFLYIEMTPSANITWSGSPALALGLPFAVGAHAEYDAQLFDLTAFATLDAGRAMAQSASPSAISQAASGSSVFTLLANHTYDLQFVYY